MSAPSCVGIIRFLIQNLAVSQIRGTCIFARNIIRAIRGILLHVNNLQKSADQTKKMARTSVFETFQKYQEKVIRWGQNHTDGNGLLKNNTKTVAQNYHRNNKRNRGTQCTQIELLRLRKNLDLELILTRPEDAKFSEAAKETSTHGTKFQPLWCRSYRIYFNGEKLARGPNRYDRGIHMAISTSCIIGLQKQMPLALSGNCFGERNLWFCQKRKYNWQRV